MHLSPPVTKATAHSKEVVLLLLIQCILLLPSCGVLCLVLDLLFSTVCSPSFAIILMGMLVLGAYLYLSFWCFVSLSVL